MPEYDESVLYVGEPRGRSYTVTSAGVDRGFPRSSFCLASLRGYGARKSRLVCTRILKNGALAEQVEAQESGSTKPKGGRLARRARSFKEDFLEILSQMRSPTSHGQRSSSPQGKGGKVAGGSPKTKSKSPGQPRDVCAQKTPQKDVELLLREFQFDLRYFGDVVEKNTLDMLPGSATVVLETVLAITMLLKNCVVNEQSSVLMSSTNQVYQSLANLIQWSDNILLQGDKAQNKENVTEVVQSVLEAVKNLIHLSLDKLASKENSAHLKGNQNGSIGDKNIYSLVKPLESPVHRNSLPDIPLTQRERDILEQTPLEKPMPHSRSSDSILNTHETGSDVDTPPPKPPLPGRLNNELNDGMSNDRAPPLPPKKRQQKNQQGSHAGSELTSSPHFVMKDSGVGSWHNSHIGPEWSGTPNVSDWVKTQTTMPNQWTSPMSQSPDSLSPLSVSASSLDSMLNHSSDDLPPQNRSSGGSGGGGNSATVLSSDVQLSFPTAEFNSLLSSLNGCDTVVPDIDTLAQKLHNLSHTDKVLSQLSRTESGFSSMRSSQSNSHSTQSSRSISTVSSTQQNSSYSQVRHSSYGSGQSPQHENSLQSSKMESSRVESLMQNIRHDSSQLQSQQTYMQMSGVRQQMSSQKSSTSYSHFEKATSSSSTTNYSTSLQADPNTLTLSVPPALPKKRNTNRRPSQYDNVPELDSLDIDEADGSPEVPLRRTFQKECLLHAPEGILAGGFVSPDGNPPPLPPKKKHIMAYMEMFGNYSQPSAGEFLRHSVHTYNMLQAQWQQHHHDLNLTASHSHSYTFSLVSSGEESIFSDPTQMGSLECSLPPLEIEGPNTPPALPPKKNRMSSSSMKAVTSTPVPKSPAHESWQEPESQMLVVEDKRKSLSPLRSNSMKFETVGRKSETDDDFGELNPLDDLDVSDYLVYKKPDEEGPDIRGGSCDALIVHATKANKNDFLYQEAFLTTYRTFVSPMELNNKLLYRYNKFSHMSDLVRQRAARNAFSLLVRVVDDLAISDLAEELIQSLMNFVFQLICSGDLILAKALRKKILEKCEAKKRYHMPNNILASLSVSTRQATLLDFKSEDIAGQMTLLDAELFIKIEIPEVLIWAQEQNEERSPNLTTFTEHFNKMSYWARTRILEQDDAKDRERYVMKFIKIMKHLRKMNNFNSYLAILSALDSAPIRRLEWQKHITEGLKEYCELIDSSSSFRAYRQALAETQPPCIPYIGLILQDLTFVHIGNSDLLSCGNTNFSKRWQQFNILDNMKRFKKCQYSNKKQDRIIAFFNNFDDYLCEESMWQISEAIKPRGGRKKQL